ncbi:MAG TPA: CDP-alcohol phosphatidyltransferase family protein [Candidatus Babeliales bacterium]|nr:CDP-alcohol phosphatidyltransferase family protein [Candidatus Babeliales bacterium]
MLESILRPTYQVYVVDPILRWVRHYSPMTITYASCVTGVVAAIVLVLRLPSLATLLLLISGFLDTLDGTVARVGNKTSSLGSVLDIVSDRIVEFAIMFGLFALDPLHRGGLTLAMLGSCYLCITSFLVVGIFTPNESNKGFHYSPGLIERAEAFIFFILMIWLPNYFSWLANLFTSLVVLTSFLRIKQFMNLSKVVNH